MKKLKDEELKGVNGGISGWAVAGICLVVTFIAGIFDGIARPEKCRS